MTNREYQKKHHRGSSPSREGHAGFILSTNSNLVSEEWKNLAFYPVSSSPLVFKKKQRSGNRDTKKPG